MTFEPQPANPIGWLILLFVTAFFFVAGVTSSSSLTVEPSEEPRAARPPSEDRGGSGVGLPEGSSLLHVESVDTVIRESFPPQISLIVSGYWPDGCGIEPQTDIRREGDTIYVRIFRVVPPDVMCTQMMAPAQVSVAITDVLMERGEFRSGSYHIDVNGITVRAAF